ncbi:PREDICTED: dentin sialophosphoprotein [Nicrophorus vespilloides]|uniref:Dentin sialophosphoprotein n=1 Tax=Nicrophorus vespilloides TaxID=110193 RepID=A0ABM1MM43_NICVS|nr:PREDICTED: dentin sialophosphoprotein [Nicrophorus vespilloides]
MYTKPQPSPPQQQQQQQQQSLDPSQQWTVHAQFTISHDGIGDPNTAPQTHTEQDENGVRMVYTWTSQPNASEEQPPETGGSFQKGNLLFTSTPPHRDSKNVDSSGYGSEMLSPNSYASGHFGGRRNSQAYNRRCKSTCSIVLSTNFNEQVGKADDSECQSQCGRTHSLRCQTPTLKCERKDAFYGCGDPWCYHSNYGDDLRFSPVPEGEELNTSCSSSSKRPSRASTYSTQHHPRSKSSPPRTTDKCKDACVQTYEMIDKCTSPLLKPEQGFKFNRKSKTKYQGRRKTEPIHQRSHSPSSSFTPDSLDSQKSKRALRALPSRLAAPELNTSNSSGDKKPRTVHIDVYCTGTEIDSDSTTSTSDSDDKTASSPQTVFESGKLKITHKRTEDDLPYHLKKNFSGKSNEISSAYPSRSSISNIRDFDSSFSSVPKSWSTISMSSYALPDDDSLANTSWKDTVSDFGSMSRSSTAQTDSLDFVPRKLFHNQTRSSIDEQPELDKDFGSSRGSLQPSDSFDYANSEDRMRIENMERMWNKWKSPEAERSHALQQQKMKEYIERRIGDSADKSDSDESDGSEKRWTFIKDDEKKLERDLTVRRASKEDKPCKSPSVLIIKNKMSKDPTLRAPFTVVPGIFTEQREIAKRFGKIVDVFKKPGHHVGPAKNPDCSCDTCKNYFANTRFRGRTRSMDSEYSNYYNWKTMNRGSEPPKTDSSLGYTDF